MLNEVLIGRLQADVERARDACRHSQSTFFEILDLLCIRTTTIAQVLEVSESAVSQYRAGRKHLPDHHIHNLSELTAKALTLARSALGQKESPEYRLRVDRADELLNSASQNLDAA